MANAAAMIARPIDNNPITLLLLRHGKNIIIEPPEGYVFLSDESEKLLRDERGAYLLINKEDQ